MGGKGKPHNIWKYNGHPYKYKAELSELGKSVRGVAPPKDL